MAMCHRTTSVNRLWMSSGKRISRGARIASPLKLATAPKRFVYHRRLMTAAMKHEPVPSTRFLIGAWIVLGIMMFILIGNRDVARAQEARVLETARQMMHADLNGWLIPQLNGEPRLRKPPLCYWYTAVSFKLFGVNEIAGRLPTMLIGWLAVCATFLLGRDIAGNQVPTARCSAWILRRSRAGEFVLLHPLLQIGGDRSAHHARDRSSTLGDPAELERLESVAPRRGDRHRVQRDDEGAAGDPIRSCSSSHSASRRRPHSRFYASSPVAIVTAIALSTAWWLRHHQSRRR